MIMTIKIDIRVPKEYCSLATLPKIFHLKAAGVTQLARFYTILLEREQTTSAGIRKLSTHGLDRKAYTLPSVAH